MYTYIFPQGRFHAYIYLYIPIHTLYVPIHTHVSVLEVSLPSEERENENTSTIRNQLIESVIPCDSCVALFEYEKDMKDYLAWCLSIQKGAANCSFSRPGPDTGPAD